MVINIKCFEKAVDFGLSLYLIQINGSTEEFRIIDFAVLGQIKLVHDIVNLTSLNLVVRVIDSVPQLVFLQEPASICIQFLKFILQRIDLMGFHLLDKNIDGRPLE